MRCTKIVSTAVALALMAVAGFAANVRTDLYYWTPTHGKADAVRRPFTTRSSIRGNSVAVGDSQYSAMAGYKILEQGGNAFDAAVAMAATTSMVYHQMNDLIGGDAMIIIYSAKDKKVITYNGTGWAPKKATIDKYIELGGIPGHGINSVEVPGSFSGWMMLLQDYGTMPLKKIFEPAAELAEKGFAYSKLMTAYEGRVKTPLNDAMKAVYYKDGRNARFPEIVKNPDYAKLLRTLGEMSYKEAEDYVYRGPVARAIADMSKELGGLMDYQDLADFRAEKIEAHSTNFHGVDVYVCPPNSQGWTLLEALNLLEPYDLKKLGHNSAAYIDVLTQALNLSLDDRNSFLADPRFHKNPLAMIGKKYADERRKAMHPGKTMEGTLPKGNADDVAQFGDAYYGKSGDTTFFTVADKEGNIVACTTSVCSIYASGLMVPGYGITLNNRMTYFFLDTDLPNYVEPRKRTVQTITPSIALKDGRPYAAFGTPGADVQEQAKLQVLLNYMIFGMDPQEAVEAPRFQTRHPVTIMGHASYPKTTKMEARIDPAVRKELAEKYGYIIQDQGDWQYHGLTNMIAFEDTGFIAGAADPRGDAYVIAW